MYINRLLYSVDIDFGAVLAGGFILVHGIGIGTVIGKGVKTEVKVKVDHRVTLGGNINKRRNINNSDFSQPWIMNDVIIYSNSTIIGPVIIENDVTVGANSVISKEYLKKVLYSQSRIGK